MPAVYNKVFKNRVTAVKKSPGRASLLNNLKDKSTLMASKSSITIIPSIQASSPRTLREEGDTTHSQQPTQHIDSPPVSPTNNSASPRMIRYIKLQNLPTDERPQEPTTEDKAPASQEIFLPIALQQKQIEYHEPAENIIYDQIINEHLIKRAQWIPSRFNKFPRFGKHSTRQTELEQQYLKMR
mgnify:CR=1 FL=1